MPSVHPQGSSNSCLQCGWNHRDHLVQWHGETDPWGLHEDIREKRCIPKADCPRPHLLGIKAAHLAPFKHAPEPQASSGGLGYRITLAAKSKLQQNVTWEVKYCRCSWGRVCPKKSHHDDGYQLEASHVPWFPRLERIDWRTTTTTTTTTSTTTTRAPPPAAATTATTAALRMFGRMWKPLKDSWHQSVDVVFPSISQSLTSRPNQDPRNWEMHSHDSLLSLHLALPNAIFYHQTGTMKSSICYSIIAAHQVF